MVICLFLFVLWGCKGKVRYAKKDDGIFRLEKNLYDVRQFLKDKGIIMESSLKLQEVLHDDRREKTINKWIEQFPKIVEELKERKVDVKILEGLTTKNWLYWAERVYDYLYEVFKSKIQEDQKAEKQRGRLVKELSNNAISTKFHSQNDTLARINRGDFFSLIYFFHEIYEITCLYEKGLTKDNKNMDCHKVAIIEEFSILETIASQMGYKVSKGALFQKYPPYENENGKPTKDNDELLLANESSFKSKGCDDEKVAVCFYTDVRKIISS